MTARTICSRCNRAASDCECDANGWPFPDRPGVPLNPERHGWHWLTWDPSWPEPAYWDGEWSQSDTSNLTVRTARYLGPLYTPAEVAARVAAARADGMREAAGIARNACLVPPDGGEPTEEEVTMGDIIEAAILAAIPEPAP